VLIALYIFLFPKIFRFSATKRIENGCVGGTLCGARKRDGWMLQLESTLRLFSLIYVVYTPFVDTREERNTILVANMP
jgi:hypothetical protein